MIGIDRASTLSAQKYNRKQAIWSSLVPLFQKSLQNKSKSEIVVQTPTKQDAPITQSLLRYGGAKGAVHCAVKPVQDIAIVLNSSSANLRGRPSRREPL